MFIDKQNLLSNDQVITTSARSDYVYDFSDFGSEIADILKEGIQLSMQVTESFSGGDSLYIKLQTDDDEAFSSPVDLCFTDTIAPEWLIAGKEFHIDYLPVGMKRYFSVYYVVSGTMLSGKINTALVLDKNYAGSSRTMGMLRVLLDTEYVPILTTDDWYIIV